MLCAKLTYSYITLRESQNSTVVLNDLALPYLQTCECNIFLIASGYVTFGTYQMRDDDRFRTQSLDQRLINEYLSHQSISIQNKTVTFLTKA